MQVCGVRLAREFLGSNAMHTGSTCEAMVNPMICDIPLTVMALKMV
jgi:hypothetical protein